jgi:hypothetical protein
MLLEAAAALALCAAPREPERGYRPLFDGTRRSLTRWTQAGPGGFKLTRNCILRSHGGTGLLWYERRLRTPYTLRVVWRMPGDDNSGVYVGFKAPVTDPAVASARGYEVQIDASDDADSTTGALYDVQAPDLARRERALRPPGRWNVFKITVSPPRIIVRLNGTVINRFTSPEPRVRLTGRHIGVQNHAPGDTIEYRSIQVRERR